MKLAVAVLSFNRPRLLRKVLEGLSHQSRPPPAIALFQDGHIDASTGAFLARERQVRRCIEEFRRAFPGAEVHATKDGQNLGVALNYLRAETWAFETLRADVCIFIEDDVYPSRHYIATMAQFAAEALKNPRIGAFSAYGNPHLGLHWQALGMRRTKLMRHRYAHGVTRAFWQRSVGLYHEYLELIGGANYRRRDTPRVLEWFSRLGFDTRCTSQDAAHDAIMVKLGCVGLSTVASYAVNFGKSGLHCSPHFFRYLRLKPRKPRFLPWALADFGFLAKLDYDRLAEEFRLTGGCRAEPIVVRRRWR